MQPPRRPRPCAQPQPPRTPRRRPARGWSLALGATLLLAVCTTAEARPLGATAPRAAASDTTRQPPRLLGRLAPRSTYLRRLLIPVLGIEPTQLRDSYLQGRSGGRTHHAIDIHAPRGTPVVAVTDGTILTLQEGKLGGITVSLLDEDSRTRYYYAHLERYAAGLQVGQRVRQGEVIGYVGDTGNAARGDYHLHFSIARLSNVRRWWEGDNLNPYPLLRQGYLAAVGERIADDE